MVNDLPDVLRFLGFTPTPTGPLVLVDNSDGKGVFISQWNEKILGPQPDEKTLEQTEASAEYLAYIDPAAVAKRAVIAAINAAKATAASNIIDLTPLIKAAVVVAAQQIQPAYVPPSDAVLTQKIQGALDAQKVP